MKTTASIIMLALGIAAPSFAAWLFTNQTFSTDILSGSYAIVSLLFIVATDYSPRRPLALPRPQAKSATSWPRQPQVRFNRFRRALRAAKIAA